MSTPNATARRRPGRAILSVVLIVLGSLLTPVAIASGWAKVVISDTDNFVATYAPLVAEPKVQAYLTDQVTTTIEQQLGLDQLVDDVIDGLVETVQRPVAQRALEALRQPATAGLRAAIEATASRVITSPAFAQVWQESLRVSHSQAVAALSGDPQAWTEINSEGLGLRLGPLIQKVKDILVEQGFALAERIPATERTIVLIRSESIALVQLSYRIAYVAGGWLGPVAIALLLGGVFAAVRRHLAAVWAAVGTGLGALVVIAAVAIGRMVAQVSVPPSTMPNDVLLLLFDTVGSGLTDLAAAVLMLATAVGLIAWFTGPFRGATNMREGYSRLVRAARERADASGLGTRGFGTFLYSQRVAIRIAIVALAVVILALNRPLQLGTVLGTTALTVGLLLLRSLLERPPAEAVESN
ncbi:MAG: hypothetical protein IPL41_04800 [Micropruina sp.]|nr:hypothetical protein [Micropruina sp.]